MEQINIAEILKDAPVGTELYSPIFGECCFEKVNKNDFIEVSFCDERNWELHRSFTSFGKYINTDGAECMLFPSKDNRDWSTFEVPKKHKLFEPFQKVLVNVRGVWTCDFYSHYNEEYGGHNTVGILLSFDEGILPYKGNEDKLGKKVK